MKKRFIYCFLIINLLLQAPFSLFAADQCEKQINDIYIIIYATQEGFTGHVGIAVDNYDIFIQDEMLNGQLNKKLDTISNGTLTYFDMFGPGEIQWERFKDNLEARFYKLPRSSAEKEITVNSILSKGIPHEYNTACDALIQIPSKAGADLELPNKIEEIMLEFNYFNPSFYNCTDFVLKCIEVHTGRIIDAREDLVFLKANTPNQLYKELLKLPEIQILKNPGDIINSSFFREIILKKYLVNLNLY